MVTSTDKSSQAIELLTNIARFVEPVNHKSGRIEVSVSFSNLPKLMSAINGVDIKSTLSLIPGLKKYSFSSWSLSATINYDVQILPFELWNDFCRIKTNPEVEQIFREKLYSIMADNH